MKLRVEFDDPDHGWIGFRVESDSGTFVESFSYTPYDSFAELATSIALIYKGAETASSTWSAEPTEIELAFSRTDETVELRIERWRDCHRTEEPGRRLTASGSFDQICRPFWRAMRNLHTRFEPAELDRRWHRQFPHDQVSRLTALLKGHE